MEERPTVWRVAANILNKQSRAAEKRWSSSLGVGRGANNASPWKTFVNKYSQGEMVPLETKQSGSRRMRWAGHVARMGEGRGVHRILVGKLGRKSPLGRPRRRWEDNIKMDLREVGGVETGWSWLRIVNIIYNIK